MKNSINRQEWSRQTGKWSLTERSCNYADTFRPNIARIKMSALCNFQGKPSQALPKSRKHLSVSKLGLTRAPLPPINRSRSSSSNAVESLAAKSLFKTDMNVLKERNTNSTMAEKAPLNASYRKTCQNSKKKISVCREVENKAEIQYPMNHGEQIKRPFDTQSPVTLTLEPLARQRKDDANQAGANANGTGVPDRVTHGASLHQAEQQRDFCSSESAIETESEDKSWLDSRPREDSDEYYTEERIAEWVLTVNSSLFRTGNDDEERQKEEQDVTTIKIVYNGE